MNIKKIVLWATVISLVWYLVTQSAAAGAAVNSALGMLRLAGTSVATFLGSM